MKNEFNLIIKSIAFGSFLLLTSISYGQWTQIGADINGTAVDDNSGFSVSLSADGSIVAIGSPLSNKNGESSGLAKVYKNTGGVWIQLGQDILGEKEFDSAGNSVSISSDGTRLVIGSPFGTGQSIGNARIFQFMNGAWVQLGQTIIGEKAGDQSGSAVAMSGDGSTVSIGAFVNGGNGTASGHVRVHKFQTTIWSYIGRDLDGEAAFDNAGIAVSLSSDGNKVAIGSPGNDFNGGNSGQIRVFQLNGTKWTQIGKDIDGEAANDQSGRSVSLSADGNIVAIGAMGNDGNGSNSGHVRVYQYIDTTWTQIGGDIDGEAAGDACGSSVSLSSDGSRVAIGASMNDGKGNNSGHVRVFQMKAGVWTQVGEDINGESAGDQSGISVSLSADGKIVAIGSNGNATNGSNSGQVRLFKESTVISTKDYVKNDRSYNIDVIPNPATDFSSISITGFEDEQKNFKLFDFCGKLLFSKKLKQNENLLSLNLDDVNLRSGCYLIQISSENHKICEPMVVIH